MRTSRIARSIALAIRIAVAELALGDPARQDRVGGVQGADVVVGVDAALEVEVVVDHVVRGVRDDEPDDREGEQAPVDGDLAGQAHRPDGEQPADQPGRDRHREDRGPGDHEPLQIASGGLVMPSGRFAVLKT